jgi:hypothetical protein
MVDSFAKLKEEIAAEQPSFDYTEVEPDMEKIRDVLLLLKKMKADSKELSISKREISVMIADITDYRDLADLEKELKVTGKTIHGWSIINIPYLVMITSPAVK